MDLIGRTIGGYRIVEELGRGGMAVVYKAWQDGLQRYVALKVLPPYYQHDREFAARFQQEALASAKLNHPNIVKIYDAAQVDGLSYIAMEYVEGRSLDRLLAERPGPLDRQTAVSIVSQIASALDYAHQAGLVHRDVKPNNILLDPEGRAVLTDFGIAHAAEGRRLTATGALIGTPEYMSPEQVEGKTVDARSDIYSLGLVAYCLLTGRAPFTATQPQAILYAQVHRQPPPLTELNPALPKAMEKAVLRALEKNPDRRYRTASEFATALGQADTGQVVAGGATTGTVASLAQKRPWVWIGVAAATVIVIVLLIMGLSNGPPPPVPTPTKVAEVTASHTPTGTASATPQGPEPSRTWTPTPPTRTPTPTATPQAGDAPEVAITSPRNGAQHDSGDTLDIYFSAQADEGLERVELWVDGRRVDRADLQGRSAATGSLDWRPRSAGRYQVEMIVHDEAGETGTSSAIWISVVETVTSTFTPTPTVTRTPTPTPIPPDVVCDFGTSKCNWKWVYTDDGARYQTSNGVLNFEVLYPDIVRQLTYEGMTFRNFAVSVRARQHSGHASGVYGLIFRHVNHKNSYLFTINGLGQFEIGGEFDNNWRYLKNYSGEQSSSAIKKKGSWNTIRIVCSGNRIRVHVNDKLVVDTTDSAFTTGKIGLVIGTTNQGNSLGVYFDDFEVYVP